MKHILSAWIIVLIVFSTFSVAFNVQQVQTSGSSVQPLADPPPTEWTQAYGGASHEVARALVRTSDGGYALAGYTGSYGAGGNDAWLVKTDANGNAQWTMTYGGAGADIANALVQTVDGGYALAGYTDSSGAGGVDFWLVKTDSSGNLQWSKTYGGTKTDIASALIQAADGGYALGGMTVSYCVGEADFWLVKTDGNGNAQWTRAYGGAGHEEGQSLMQATDGGYALAGWTNSYGAGADDMWLVKTDAAGNLQWSKTYGGSWYDEAWALVRTTDGGYALAGEAVASVNSATNSYLVKTDGNGNTQWEKTYGGSIIHNRASALVQTTDGGYALAGHIYPPANIYNDFWLVKTDSIGNQQWNKTCGGADNHDMASALVQTVDGGYAVGGWTYSYGAGSADFWLVKVGSTSPPPTYSLTITVTAGGTTSPTPGVYECAVGTIVEVTALQYSGYQFDHWELDSVNVGTANPYSVTMNAAHTLLAFFVGAPTGCGWPVLVAPVQISSSTGYSVGDTLTVEFTIQNQGTAAIHLDKLLLGGRFNGGTLPGGGFPDFSYSSVTLQVGQTYLYEGTLHLTEAGYYQFFVAYYIADPTDAEKQLLDPNNWNTCIDLALGLTDNDRTWSVKISERTRLIYGKGIWIWYLDGAEGGDVAAIIARLQDAGVTWVAIKCGESTDFWSTQCTPTIISQFHEAGIKIYGWQYVYGDAPIEEADVANNILNTGVDGLIIDAEGEYEGKPTSATTYMQHIREEHPESLIAYTTFPIVDYHQNFPYLEFGRYCDAVMPQAYWKEIASSVTPTRMFEWMEEQWDKWHMIWEESGNGDSIKPIIPIGQGYSVSGSEIAVFCNLVYYNGYVGVSLWRYDLMTVENWNAYANCFNPQLTLAAYSPVDLTITDPDGHKINKTLCEIEGATYMEFDKDGDGDSEDVVTVLQRKLGNYSILVTPELGANATDTFTLELVTVNGTAVLADNVTISEIPSEPYGFVATDETPPITWIDIGEPKFLLEGIMHVTPTTPVALLAQDDVGGSGIASTTYRICNETYNSGWRTYTAPFRIQGLVDGVYRIDFNSTDTAENEEPANTANVTFMNHNIATNDMTLSKTVVGQGFSLLLNVTIQNQGSSAENINVTFYANTTVIGTLTAIVLAGGNSTTIASSWNTIGFVMGNYTILTIVDQISGETYMEDNTLIGGWVIVTLPGDADGDRDIDIFDIVLMAIGYGTLPPNPEYNSNCDIDGDGDIDIFDIVAAATHYGESW